MFVELMPVLAGRTVLISVTRVDDKTIRVCVIPKKVKEDDNPALATPLSYTGTPEELDVELGKHLASYVECHTQLGSTLVQAKAEMEAAAKAVQEEARKKATERNKKSTERTTAAVGTYSAPRQQTADGVAEANTLFGCTAPTEPAGTAKPAGGESTCRLAL